MTISSPFPRIAGRGILVLTLITIAGPFVSAQPPIPATIALSNFTTVSASANPALGQDGGFTSATGTGGANPGWTLFQYGTANGGGRLRFDSTSTNPATIQYWTANPATPTVSGTPINFSSAVPGSWTIISPKSGSTGSLQILANDAVPGIYLNLNNSALLNDYNLRLNQILKFDANQWYDPMTNAVISPSAGVFQYSFTDFDNTLGYRSIQLQYTPVPEPNLFILIGLLTYGIRRHINPARPVQKV